MEKQNNWIRYAVVIVGGKRNGKMTVVAVDIDSATIRLIEFQARKFQFGVGGHLSASQQEKGNRDSHISTFVCDEYRPWHLEVAHDVG